MQISCARQSRACRPRPVFPRPAQACLRALHHTTAISFLRDQSERLAGGALLDSRHAAMTAHRW